MPFTITVDGRELPLSEEEETCGSRLCLFGGLCCLCTACLSWVPLCCYCQMKKKKYSYDTPPPQHIQPSAGQDHTRTAIDGTYHHSAVAPQPQPNMGEIVEHS